jgi:tryptophan synthase alpha chain
VLSIFLTAGFPEPDSTPSICRWLAEVGVDLIELGFPFSDSLVDGPTIQQCNEQALRSGMTLARYFDQAARIRGEIAYRW